MQMKSFFSKYAIRILDWSVKRPDKGLLDDIFYYISRNTPLVNVDLLIKDKNQRVLLAWRDDQYTGKGWHIPGGILRYKENIKERIKMVAESEIGASVICKPSLVALKEIIVDQQRDRGHFISLLYTCTVHEEYRIDNGNLTPNQPGYLMWHNGCPDNLLSWHEIYRDYIK